MHDIKAIEASPDWYISRLVERGVADAEDIIRAVITKHEEYRHLQTQIQYCRSKKNDLSMEFAHAKQQKSPVSTASTRVKADQLNKIISGYETQLHNMRDHLDALATLPNIADPAVPIGTDATSNTQSRVWGNIFAIDNPKDHTELGLAMGLMDFEQTAKIAGARYATLRGPLAQLERALASFMLAQAHAAGYVEHQVPLVVNETAMYGTGQFPKFKDDVFATNHNGYLIPTSEVSLTNLVNNKILMKDELPIRMTALTPCFRAEAGSAGKDTKGLIRQHQFNKVELVSIVDPERAEAEFLHMQASAELILQSLKLPYRTMLLCTGDMGFSAKKTFDLEVWLPSQATYREISSVSWCGDFQARRMAARYKETIMSKTELVHTLNGSALAVGRTLVAVMENYQQADGSISIPEVLHPYINGKQITPAGLLV